MSSHTPVGLRSLSNIQVRSRSEAVGKDHNGWWPLYLLLISRYASLAPSIWLYAGNTALIAIVSLRLMAQTPDSTRHRTA